MPAIKLDNENIGGHLTPLHWASCFYAVGGPIWIKFRRLVQNDMSTAVIWSKSKPEVQFQYGGRLGEFNCMLSQSHVPHCRVEEFHLPYWKSFFAVFYFFVFLMQFGLWRAATFVSSPIHTCLGVRFGRQTDRRTDRDEQHNRVWPHICQRGRAGLSILATLCKQKFGGPWSPRISESQSVTVVTIES